MNESIGVVFLVGAIGLSLLGIAGIVLSNHLFRMVLALAIAEAGANLLLILAGYRWDAVPPIVDAAYAGQPMVDPVPQAMVLTAIVIGVGVQALALSLVIRIRHRYGTLDMRQARHRMQQDIDRAAGVSPPRSAEGPVGERPLPAPAAIADSGGRHD
jgi:multisubunit Na+/H+ antiporter MnhC subunit